VSRQQATNRELGTDTARANLLTNGGFEIWQRGNGPVTYGGSADQWFLYAISGGAVTFEKDTTQPDTGSACMLEKVTTYGTDVIHVVQKLENPLAYRGKTLSLSLRVNPSVTGMMRAEIYDGVAGFQTSISSGTGWQTLTRTATISATATCVWVFITALKVGQAYIDSAMLVWGAVPTNYIPMHPADDLIRCQRYYERVGGVAVELIMSTVYTAASQTVYWSIPYMVTKGGTPTITKLGSWPTSGMSDPPCDSIGTGMARFALTSTAAGPAYVNPQPNQGFVVEWNPS
jgi:hypothetical protein